MNFISQSFLQIPLLENRTIRVSGDRFSLYDLMRSVGSQYPHKIYKRTPFEFETGCFLGSSSPTPLVTVDEWLSFVPKFRDEYPAFKQDRLDAINAALGVIDHDKLPKYQAIAPSAAPDVSVNNSDGHSSHFATLATASKTTLVADQHSSQNVRTSDSALIADGKLIFPELNNAEIRSDGDRFSVHDFIQIVGGQKNPWEVWKRLCEKYSELLTICEEYKFPHCKGGAARKTPATDKKGLIEIAQLLPGEFGAKFRREAANIILAYLDADVTLADAVVDRAVAKGKVKEVEQHAARTQGIILRKQLTSVLAAHGVNKDGYRMVTNAIYIGLLGKPASALRKEMGLAQGENVRSRLNPVKWMSIGTIEAALPVQLEKQQAWGNEACAKIAYETALKIGQLIGLAA